MYITTNIPDEVTTIGSYAFSGCTNFKYINGDTDGELKLGKISDINTSTFYGCSSLKKVYINNNITNIYNSAFKGCTNLNEINLPTSITNIGSNTFEGCISLNEINLPPSITNIGSSAFKGCTSLKKVSFGESPKLKVLNDSIFEGCTNLDEISLPSDLTKIGNSAFYECTNLWKTISAMSSLVMPDSITTIGHHAFYGCDKINIIGLPSNLKKIGTQCFVNDLLYINGTPVMPMADFDIAYESKILTIGIPEDLTSPPIFTNINGMADTKATPFGSPKSKSIYLKIPRSLSNTYLYDTYWKQYSSVFLR